MRLRCVASRGSELRLPTHLPTARAPRRNPFCCAQVIKRRHRIRGDFGMINSVGRGAIARAAAQQLRVTLPRDLLMLEAPISEYGEFKVRLRGVRSGAI